jgi:hypothetical protein
MVVQVVLSWGLLTQVCVGEIVGVLRMLFERRGFWEVWLGRMGIMHIAGGYGRRRIVTFFNPFAVCFWIVWGVVDLAYLFIFGG